MRNLIVALCVATAGQAFGAELKQAVDYSAAMNEAIANGKKVIVYFQADSTETKTTAAQNFENTVLTNPDVIKKLSEEYVFVTVKRGDKQNGTPLIKHSSFEKMMGAQGFALLTEGKEPGYEVEGAFPFIDSQSLKPWEQKTFLDILSGKKIEAAAPSNPNSTEGLSPERKAVVDYLSARIGRRVGSGDCYQIVSNAYAAAGCRKQQISTHGQPLRNVLQPGDAIWYPNNYGGHWLLYKGNGMVFEQNFHGGRSSGQHVRVRPLSGVSSARVYRPAP